MTQANISQFLSEEPKEYWIEKKILFPRANITLLQGNSIEPLLSEMADRGVDRLVYGDIWYLDRKDFRFKNVQSREMLEGHLNKLKSKGNVFRRMNSLLNPYYMAGSEDNEELDVAQVKERLMSLKARMKDIEAEIGDLIDRLK